MDDHQAKRPEGEVKELEQPDPDYDFEINCPKYQAMPIEFRRELRAHRALIRWFLDSGYGAGRPLPNAPITEQPEGRAMGRPRSGKKSDPSYRQVTVYLPADLYQQGRDEVYRLSRGTKEQQRDFSEIIAEALRAHFRKSESPEV